MKLALPETRVGSPLAFRWLGVAAAALVMALPLWLGLVIPHEGTQSFWQFRLAEIFLLAVFALSFDLLLGHMGTLSLGHALFFGGSGYVTAVMTRTFGVPVVVSVVIAIGFAALVGALFGLLTVRIKGIYHAMTTLAIAEAAVFIVLAPELASTLGGEDGIRRVPIPPMLDAELNRTAWYYLALILLAAAVGFMWLLLRTRAGKVLAAIRENEVRAAAVGYNVTGFRVFAFVVAGAMAGAAGSATSLLHAGASPSMLGIMLTAAAVVGVIVGGSGVLLGPVIGVALVMLGQDLLRASLGNLWILVYALAGIVVLLSAPRGLVKSLIDRRNEGSAHR